MEKYRLFKVGDLTKTSLPRHTKHTLNQIYPLADSTCLALERMQAKQTMDTVIHTGNDAGGGSGRKETQGGKFGRAGSRMGRVWKGTVVNSLRLKDGNDDVGEQNKAVNVFVEQHKDSLF